MSAEHLRMMQAMKSLPRDSEAVLATVVRIAGSSYRSLGARMLILPDGQRIGSVSGGCIEGEIAKKSWWWTDGGTNHVRRYDTKLEEDESGYGLACNGSINVLIERVRPSDPESPLTLLDDIYRNRSQGVIATLFQKEPNGHTKVYGRAVLMESDTRISATKTINAAQMAALAPSIHSAMLDQTSSHVSLEISGAACDVLLEFVDPPLRLLVFGAGFDAAPVVRFAAELGWQVTVCDGRADLARPERFPDAERVFAFRSIDDLASIRTDHRTACVIMTHSYEQDQALLSYWLRARLPYLGILGARSRTQEMLDNVSVPFDASNIYAPAGLDIGSETPEEIALSIIAEIQACFRNGRGTSLRDRSGTIHSREPVRAA